MSDPNTPRYGEIATPEQQAAARGPVSPEPAPAVPTPEVPSYQAPAYQAAPPQQQPPAYQAPGYGVPAPGAPVAPPAGYSPWQGAPNEQKRGLRPVDATITIVLLAIGLLSTLVSLMFLLPLPELLEQAFVQEGIGQFTSHESARTLAMVGIIGQLVLLAGATWASIAGIVKRRLSWWIPFVAGVLAVILVTVIFFAAIMSDPAFTSAVENGTF